MHFLRALHVHIDFREREPEVLLSIEKLSYILCIIHSL